MIELNCSSKMKRAVYATCFQIGKIIQEMEALGVDEEYSAPVHDQIMKHLGEMGVFGREM